MEEINEILGSKHQTTFAETVWDSAFVPKTIWRRFDSGANRFYYGKVNDQPRIAIGITTAIKKVMPDPPFIQEWKDKNANWKTDLIQFSGYGTLLHMAFQTLLKKESIPQIYIDAARDKFGRETQFKKDCFSLIKFITDYEIEPIFFEGILAKEYIDKKGNPHYISTAIDLFCKIKYVTKTKTTIQEGVYVRGEKKGQPKYVDVTEDVTTTEYAIIDLKSNPMDKEEKTFFDTHKYQLIFGKDVIESHYDVKDVKMFNISPLGWKTEPKYIVKEHLDTENSYGFRHSEILEAKLHIGLSMGLFDMKGKVFLANEIKIGSTYDNLSYLELAETLLSENT